MIFLSQMVCGDFDKMPTNTRLESRFHVGLYHLQLYHVSLFLGQSHEQAISWFLRAGL